MLKVYLFVCLVVLLQCEAKKFTRCGLVQELRKQGFPESQLRDWVCLIESESGRDTSVINTNSNGSKDYGLFQINDGYWCSKTSTAGKDCNVTCANLITDDITRACKCAKIIYNRHKFSAWYGWKNKCQTASSLPNISSC